ncbi:hypothetical protein ACFRCI_33745 [Streptomyces sp. NPDC056638]|uniref:hypothetical protein n=1 Tax=Streptomyces sp. NPDC056638 TaxID=3345887 RepID=UPI0036909B37
MSPDPGMRHPLRTAAFLVAALCTLMASGVTRNLLARLPVAEAMTTDRREQGQRL